MFSTSVFVIFTVFALYACVSLSVMSFEHKLEAGYRGACTGWCSPTVLFRMFTWEMFWLLDQYVVLKDVIYLFVCMCLLNSLYVLYVHNAFTYFCVST